MIVIKDTDLIFNIIKNHKVNIDHILTFKKKYPLALRYLARYTNLTKTIIRFIVTEYMDEEFTLTVKLINVGENYYTLLISSCNVNISFEEYRFRYCHDFRICNNNMNHRLFYQYISNQILSYDRCIVHNFDKSKDQQRIIHFNNDIDKYYEFDYDAHGVDDFKDVISAYNFKYPKNEYIFTNKYYNEQNTIIYNINNHRMFRNFIVMIGALITNIDKIIDKFDFDDY